MSEKPFKCYDAQVRVSAEGYITSITVVITLYTPDTCTIAQSLWHEINKMDCIAASCVHVYNNMFVISYLNIASLLASEHELIHLLNFARYRLTCK